MKICTTLRTTNFFTRFIPIYAVVNVQYPTSVGLVGSSGLEPPTSRLSGVCSNQLSYEPVDGGGNRVRTDDPLLAGQVLYQLSYTPIYILTRKSGNIKRNAPYTRCIFLY